jgi:hypothetical protein
VKLITQEMLRIYREFDGKNDIWVLAGCPNKEIIPDAHWHQIDQILQELTLVKRGIASPEYALRIQQKLALAAEDAVVADELLSMA